MIDNILNAGLLCLVATLAVAAGASSQGPARPAAATVAPQVVQLPLVAVSGRRVPTMEAVEVAAGVEQGRATR
jgi:hypothetical protein